MRRFLPFAALLGVAFVLGCQDVGTVREKKLWCGKDDGDPPPPPEDVGLLGGC